MMAELLLTRQDKRKNPVPFEETVALLSKDSGGEAAISALASIGIAERDLPAPRNDPPSLAARESARLLQTMGPDRPRPARRLARSLS